MKLTTLPGRSQGCWNHAYASTLHLGSAAPYILNAWIETWNMKKKIQRKTTLDIYFVKYMFQAVSGRVALKSPLKNIQLQCLFIYMFIVGALFDTLSEATFGFWEFRRKGPSVVGSGNRTSSAESLGTKQLFTDVHREPKAKILKHLDVNCRRYRAHLFHCFVVEHVSQKTVRWFSDDSMIYDIA